MEYSWMDVYRVVSWILTSAGIWKILEKCDEKGWYALLPGVRYYKLGDVAGRERDGRLCLVFEVLLQGVNLGMRFLDQRSRNYAIASVILLACFIILAIALIRVFSGLCLTFGRSKLWMFAWVLVSEVPALMWGFLDKYQPVNLGLYTDDELLAGTNPLEVKSWDDDNWEEGEGLVVHLRDRTAYDFTKKRYLLKDIHFTIPNKSLVLLLGGSGSGKTTLVNAVIGYEKANAVITLNGVDIYKNYEQMKYKIGFVPQQDLLRMNDTVYSTLYDSANLRLPVQMNARDRKERIKDVMEVLGLTAGKAGLVAKKSGGQKKRISIGMELISDPDLFILDEPDSGLDGVIARELFEKLRMIADEGNIVITITHTPDRVADLFDKVIVLARDSGRVGRLAFFGSPDEAREFFGKKTMEEIVMAVSKKDEGGEGRADEFIGKYAEYVKKEMTGEETETEPENEAPEQSVIETGYEMDGLLNENTEDSEKEVSAYE